MGEAWPQYSIRSRKALVVGGTGGIGWEVSRLLAEAGADLVIHGRDGAKTAARASSLGAKPFHHEIRAEATARFIDAVSGLLPLDILVVAFGPLARRPLHQTSAADWMAMASICLALPGALVSACLPGMAERGFGRILLFGGNRTDAPRGVPGMTAYAAAKTGLGVIAKSVAKGYGSSGVSCTVVCPGLVDTEYLSEAERTEWRSLAPSGALQAPGELAAKALALALDENLAFNGAVINADAGFLA